MWADCIRHCIFEKDRWGGLHPKPYFERDGLHPKPEDVKWADCIRHCTLKTINGADYIRNPIWKYCYVGGLHPTLHFEKDRWGGLHPKPYF